MKGIRTGGRSSGLKRSRPTTGGFRVAVGEQCEGGGDLDGVFEFLCFFVGYSEDGDWGCAFGGFEETFHCSELRGLFSGDEAGGGIAGNWCGDGGDCPEDECDGEGPLGEDDVAVFEEVVGADAHDEEGAGEHGADPDVDEPVDGGRVEDEGPEVDDFGAFASCGRDDVVAGRGLLPTVGDDDPDGREDGSEADHEGGEEVHLLSDAVPAEDEDGEEARFEEEGEDSFGRESGAEDVADEAGIDGPVGAELELHDDSGRDADGEGNGEEFDPELGEAVPVGIACLEPDGLEDDEEHSHPDGKGRKEVVHHNGEGELDSGEKDDVEFHGGDS